MIRSRTFAAAALLALSACAGSSARNVRLTAEEERILRPLADPPDRVRRLVEEGDELFCQGIPPYRGSDPETGSDWASQVPAALDFYSRARTAYLTAQSEYSSPQPVPPPLLDRVRECVMRIALLQRRKHSTPQK
jgi:hypothetical protein